MKALVTLGTLAVFLYVEIKAGSFGNDIFTQMKNQFLGSISKITDGLGNGLGVDELIVCKL